MKVHRSDPRPPRLRAIAARTKVPLKTAILARAALAAAIAAAAFAFGAPSPATAAEVERPGATSCD